MWVLDVSPELDVEEDVALRMPRYAVSRRLHMRTFAAEVQAMTTYIPPTEAGARAHADALDALRSLTMRITQLALATDDDDGATVDPQVFQDIATAVQVYAERVAPYMPRPTREALNAADALNAARMCATRAAGAKCAVGARSDWYNELWCALMRLEYTVARAIAVADQAGDLAPAP